jgi:hypothetical protein
LGQQIFQNLKRADNSIKTDQKFTGKFCFPNIIYELFFDRPTNNVNSPVIGSNGDKATIWGAGSECDRKAMLASSSAPIKKRESGGGNVAQIFTRVESHLHTSQIKY